MSRYDPAIHHRRSIRLPAYDYSLPGSYFVTICTHQRVAILSDVDGEAVRLSAAGQVVDEALQSLGTRFPGVAVDALVIMPNHVHAIITIADGPLVGTQCIAPNQDDGVGAQFIAPDPTVSDQGESELRVMNHAPTDESAPGDVGARFIALNPDAPDPTVPDQGGSALGAMDESTHGDVGARFIAPIGDGPPQVPTLGQIVRAFKASSARVIRGSGHPEFGWQRNYYERVIRDERELLALREYIATNPARWADDDLYPNERERSPFDARSTSRGDQ